MQKRRVATKIAEELFIGGMQQEAQRLVLEIEAGKFGGGWCKSAVIDLIERHLKAASLKATSLERRRKRR